MKTKGLLTGGSLAGLAVGLASLASLLVAAQASAFIYWGDSQHQTIGRANNDGSGVNNSFIPTGALPTSVAVDAAHIYWTNQNGESIGRANIDGSGVNNSFIAAPGGKPTGVAVNGTSIFWATLAGNIGKANLDGSAPKPNFITGAVEPCGVALDSGHVYWADIASGTPAYIGRAGLDGSNKQLTYVTITGTSFPCGVAVNSANIFWSEPGFFGGGTRIGRANTNTGTGVDPSFIGDASTPCGIALDGSQLYWSNSGTNAIGRANADGTGVNQAFVQTGGNQICGIAVDSLFLVPPPAPPAPQPGPVPDTTKPTATIGVGPGKALADGKAKFRFKSNEKGSTFSCKLDGRKPAACKSPKSYVGLKPGRHTFKVWATDAAGNKSAKPAKRTFRVPA